jgi:hypothetical protein
MRRNKKKPPAVSTEPRYYLEWFREARKCAPNETVLFGWLSNTMSVEELLAIKVAADQYGAEVKLARDGSGEVIYRRSEEG